MDSLSLTLAQDKIAGCEIRICYHWPPGQCIIETYRPIIDFTGPNYLHIYENIKIAKYIFIMGLKLRENDLKLSVLARKNVFQVFLNFLLSNSHWPIGPVGGMSPLALHQSTGLGHRASG